MAELDVYDFIEQNGKAFFIVNSAVSKVPTILVKTSVSVRVEKAKLDTIHAECERRNITVAEFFCEMISDRLDDY